MNNMFAPMSVRLAEMGERDRKELAEARERERLEREAAAARDKTTEQLDEEFRQRALATAPVSFGAVEARAQAAADKVEREKQEHMADIKLLGAVIASELKPVLAELVTEIRSLVGRLKEHSNGTL